jgi:sugar lactone lactonase YvrE
MKSVFGLLFAMLAVAGLGVSSASADLLVVTELTTGRLVSYTTPGAGATEFAQLNLRSGDGLQVLSGIHFHAGTDRLYVTELDANSFGNGRVHILNATTRQILGTQDFAYGVTGIAVAANGDFFVSGAIDQRGGLLRRYDSNFDNPETIILGTSAPASGLIFRGDDLYINTFQAGIYRYDGSSVTQFVAPSATMKASAQLAFDSEGNLYAGHGLGDSNFAHRFDANGTEFLVNGDPFLEVTEAMVGSWGGSSDGTSPSGITLDGNGNLVVAALGRSNPFEGDGERGGLFLFDRQGKLLDTFASGSRSYSGVAFVSPVPEPGSLVLLGFAGLAAALRRRR